MTPQQTPPIRPLVAVIEDDPGLCADLVEFLQMREMTARGFESAEDFFRVWPAQHFDLLLLDVALPGANGLEVAQQVRALGDTGIVILTALDAAGLHVAGLGAGADAYLSKQSPLEVIEATCRSVLRRLSMKHVVAQVARTAVTTNAWRLQRKRWVLETPSETVVGLTHTEQIFLVALFETPGTTVARKKLLELLGKQDTISNQRNLDNAASRLRRKVQQACGIEFPIRPSYGQGYTFIGECEITT